MFDKLIDILKANPRRIVFTEGPDARILEAASRLKKDGFLDPKVLSVDINTLLYQVPGGMLSNLINQLKQMNASDKLMEVLQEVPRVRKDFGYPPLVTPTSQIVGTQAVLNVVSGQRYKTFTKESRGLLRGEYGRLPAPVNEDVRKKAIGDEKVITCRPADLLEPELPKLREECREWATCDEDVLSYALFPQVAEKFIKLRNTRHPLGQRFIKPLEHAEKVERHVAPLSRKK